MDVATTKLLWDVGTAYDLFVSLEVLRDPAHFGVRGAWVAGVRARLAPAERETLEQFKFVLHVPLVWVYTLPQPKDGAAVLWALGQIPPAQRLSVLAFDLDWPDVAYMETLRNVAARGVWNEQDLKVLQPLCEHKKEKNPLTPEDLSNTLNVWAHAAESGERYLTVLRAYQEVFFAEEERRIRPALEAAVARAQELAGRLELLDLLEELSQGLRFETPIEEPELALAPSYWCTPLMYFGRINAERRIFLFGARPPDASLVPGEAVPDALVRALQALSDPTRLRILYYLNEKPLSPTELARRLRLRTPTVLHHLNTLRLAGLVQVTLGAGKETKTYAVRAEAVAAAFASLQGFLQKGGTPPTELDLR
jgi:DNA-binding transcriptional ArsR family regulator